MLIEDINLNQLKQNKYFNIVIVLNLSSFLESTLVHSFFLINNPLYYDKWVDLCYCNHKLDYF